MIVRSVLESWLIHETVMTMPCAYLAAVLRQSQFGHAIVTLYTEPAEFVCPARNSVTPGSPYSSNVVNTPPTQRGAPW